MLSPETLAKYAEMPVLQGIEAMINDMVDTPIIMELIRSYGGERFKAGRKSGMGEQESRSRNRPGNGDMGG